MLQPIYVSIYGSDATLNTAAQMRSAFTKKYGRIREKRTKLHAIVHFSVKDCVCVSMDVLCIGFNSMFNWFVRDLDRVQIYIFSNFDRCRRENL